MPLRDTPVWIQDNAAHAAGNSGHGVSLPDLGTETLLSSSISVPMASVSLSGSSSNSSLRRFLCDRVPRSVRCGV